MHKNIFIILIVLISGFGILLRLNNYDRIPGFTETQDEFFYPWSGMTFLTTGIPIGWSWFPSYAKRDIVTYWGAKYPLVSPWIEKPPLFSLMSGAWVLLNGERKLDQVRLSTIRLVPIGLSFLTIVLTGVLASQVFNKKTGIVAAILYAVIPPIVLSNRMSLTENLLTPLSLLTTIILLYQSSRKSWRFWQPFIAGISAAAVVLTKNIGIVSGVLAIMFFLTQKRWNAAVVCALIVLTGILIHPLIGYYYNWKLFVEVMNQYKIGFINQGLPQLIQTIFTYPVITTKDRLLPDGALLLGYLLLFSSPLWILNRKNAQQPQIEEHKLTNSTRGFISAPFLISNLPEKLLLAFPLGVILLLAVLASGSGYSFYGWHVYPLFPYLVILISVALVDLWTTPNLFQLIIITLTLIPTIVRNILIFFPRELFYRWQLGLVCLTLIILTTIYTPKKIRQIVLIVCFILFISVEVYTVLNISKIYQSIPQPLQ